MFAPAAMRWAPVEGVLVCYTKFSYVIQFFDVKKQRREGTLSVFQCFSYDWFICSVDLFDSVASELLIHPRL